jgi:membrane-associated phospholipid phosphatase
MSLNTRLFFKINALVGKSPALDFFGKVGAEYAVLVMGGYFTAAVFVQNWPDHVTSLGKLLFAACAWSLGWLFNLVIGKIVREPRPHITYPQSTLMFRPLQSWKSFPSDHGMTAWLMVFFSLRVSTSLAGALSCWSTLCVVGASICWGTLSA